MSFPMLRPRRLRQSPEIRSLVRETTLTMADIIAPIFVRAGSGLKTPISSLDGLYHFSSDRVVEEARELMALGVKAVILFGLPEKKDRTGSEAISEHGVVQQAIRAIKSQKLNLLVVADLCFCEYTDHGHCGVLRDEEVDNDSTLELIVQQALSLAAAGADVIAPSGMMDGAVSAIRCGLEEAGFKNTIIMSYSAKYSSGYYGPFREAAGCCPSFGDRSSYQMDPANSAEAMREIAEDIEEGADIVMVKPALAYLDIIRLAKDSFSFPLAAYNVSGEYAMIKLAAKSGIIDGDRVILETVQSIKRAGADIIITYFARDLARLGVR